LKKHKPCGRIGRDSDTKQARTLIRHCMDDVFTTSNG